jgi:Flp pilus assembly pilin Flp
MNSAAPDPIQEKLNCMVSCRILLRSLLEDERGQDLIEYALLSATIGLAGFSVLTTMSGALSTAYSNWSTATPAIAEMPDPVP